MSRRRVAAVGVALLAVVACTGDDGGDAVADALGSQDGSTPAESLREIVDAVAEHGAADEQLVEVARAMGAHPDELRRLDRPQVVDALAQVLGDEEAADVVVEALSGWVVTVVEPAVDAPDAVDAAEDVLRSEVAPVVQAAMAAAEEADGPSSGEVLRAVTQPAREALAEAIAARDGQAPPAPGSHAEVLSSAWPSGDPVEDLERTVSDVSARLDGPEAGWP